MRTILIPTDFSDNAGDALAYSLALIGNTKANIHIVNVVDPNIPPADVAGGSINLMNEKVETAKNAMKALEVFSKDYYGKGAQAQVVVTTQVTIGKLAHSIKAEAASVEADLIIMGTQGVNHSFIEKTLGSISTLVLKEAPCPVILIPRGYKFKTIDNLLFSTNLNHSDPYELWRATQLIKPHVGVIRCLHVVKNAEEKDDRHLEEFAKYMIEHSPSIQTIFNVEVSDDIEATILDYAKNYDAEMIIMHRIKQSFWDRLLEASHTKRMASLIEVPMMVMDDGKAT